MLSSLFLYSWSQRVITEPCGRTFTQHISIHDIQLLLKKFSQGPYLVSKSLLFITHPYTKKIYPVIFVAYLRFSLAICGIIKQKSADYSQLGVYHNCLALFLTSGG